MYTLTPSIILTLDILGFSNQVSEAKTKEKQERLLKKIDTAASDVKGMYGIFSAHPWDTENNCNVKIYTDNFIAAITYNPDNPDEKKSRFDDMLIYAAFHQWRFAKDGLFIRGSITAGPNFMNDNIVFGSAMIRGHYLEEKIAKYPRIIIDTALYPLIDYNDPSLLIDEEDGMCFVNYLQTAPSRPKSFKTTPSFVASHRKLIIQNLNKYTQNQPVREKYLWLRNYHDFYCSNNFRSVPELQISPKSSALFSNITLERLQQLKI